MTDTDRMVAWLRETMDSAERDAEAATPGPWAPEGALGADVVTSALLGRVADCSVGTDYRPQSIPDAAHIARHDPAAVLRRIAADRKQHDEHIPVPDHGRFSHSYGEKCPALCEGECRDNPKVCLTCRDSSGDPIEAPCRSLEFLVEAWGWTEEEQR
ncbi:DUF6221 family protein [Streptomyces sp. NPDC051554]|uniref:DUF6221 family protein n=1 Tax=Streptomyces sp. NPDC051554 TaxID=3365656 RepID=UPI0037AB25E7